jgi:hypothetical protein
MIWFEERLPLEERATFAIEVDGRGLNEDELRGKLLEAGPPSRATEYPSDPTNIASYSSIYVKHGRLLQRKYHHLFKRLHVKPVS